MKKFDICEIARVKAKNDYGILYSSGCPGVTSDLERDLSKIKSLGVDTIVCLMEWKEFKRLNILDYAKTVQESGMIFYHLPIQDMKIPKKDEIMAFIPDLINSFTNGHKILIHCKEGLGRAGTICACFLTHFDYNYSQAIATVRRLRPGSILTIYQEQFVQSYCRSLVRVQ